MANKKLTKREKYEMLAKIPAVTDNPILAEFVAHEMELLAKKNAGDKKPTANQVANESLKAAILAGMEANRFYTVSELMKTIPELAEATNQKVSALLRQLVIEKAVNRTEDKRKAYFSLA
jgi:predicted transcriptional regulator